MKDIKVGDIVHVRGTAVAVDDVGVALSFVSGVPEKLWFSPEHIVHVEPRPIKVGDRVQTAAGNRVLVIAINGDHAWIKFDGGCHATENLGNLTPTGEPF